MCMYIYIHTYIHTYYTVQTNIAHELRLGVTATGFLAAPSSPATPLRPGDSGIPSVPVVRGTRGSQWTPHRVAQHSTSSNRNVNCEATQFRLTSFRLGNFRKFRAIIQPTNQLAWKTRSTAHVPHPLLFCTLCQASAATPPSTKANTQAQPSLSGSNQTSPGFCSQWHLNPNFYSLVQVKARHLFSFIPGQPSHLFRFFDPFCSSGSFQGEQQHILGLYQSVSCSKFKHTLDNLTSRNRNLQSPSNE